MAKYKEYSYAQGQFIPVVFDKQILPGTFEYTLTHLVDNELDLSYFDERYKNDDGGAPAYDPRILLKIVLFAYSRGIISSRKIAKCCEENITFMALSANTRPHFTTVADFISSLDKEIVKLFRDILLICDDMGLIGKDMFAVDGCKLPSNAAKEWSGTKADFKKKAEKMEKAMAHILETHRNQDLSGHDDIVAQEKKYVKTLQNRLAKLRDWLDNNDDKPGKTGKPKKSNITDNDSAKMKTSKGVIQGYDGVAMADAKHQIVVAAEAFGEAQEHGVLEPMVDLTVDNFSAIGKGSVFKDTKLTADSGFHSEKNMEMLAAKEIDSYVADNLFRKRDPRFADYNRYKERTQKERARREGRKGSLFKAGDFTFADDLSHCICPAGKRLYRSGHKVVVKNHLATKFKAPNSACGPCQLRSKCLRHPDRTPTRQVAYFHGRSAKGKLTFTEKMKRKIDSTRGRAIYQKRLGTVEPVFANICSSLGLNRFSLRGKNKVNTQWLMYCLVHNLTKLQHYGPA